MSKKNTFGIIFLFSFSFVNAQEIGILFKETFTNTNYQRFNWTDLKLMDGTTPHPCIDVRNGLYIFNIARTGSFRRMRLEVNQNANNHFILSENIIAVPPNIGNFLRHEINVTDYSIGMRIRDEQVNELQTENRNAKGQINNLKNRKKQIAERNFNSKRFNKT